VRVALLADTKELRLSLEYVEVLARPHGTLVRVFSEESVALHWLRGQGKPVRER